MFYLQTFMPSLQHCAKNPIYVFPDIKLYGLVPNSYIHVAESNLYIPRLGLPIWLQQSRHNDPRNIEITHRYMNVEIGRQNINNSVLEITRPRSLISENT